MLNQDLQKINSQLSGNERVLWHDRPKQGFILRPHYLFFIPFSVLWVGGISYFLLTNAKEEYSSIFNIFVFIAIIQLLYVVVGQIVFDILRRRNSYYAVTNERIIIVSGIFSQETTSLNLN